MTKKERLSRKQELFLQELLKGQSIVAAAKIVGAGERTARRWIADPLFQAERTRREDELRMAEQAEIITAAANRYSAALFAAHRWLN